MYILYSFLCIVYAERYYDGSSLRECASAHTYTLIIYIYNIYNIYTCMNYTRKLPMTPECPLTSPNRTIHGDGIRLMPHMIYDSTIYICTLSSSNAIAASNFVRFVRRWCTNRRVRTSERGRIGQQRGSTKRWSSKTYSINKIIMRAGMLSVIGMCARRRPSSCCPMHALFIIRSLLAGERMPAKDEYMTTSKVTKLLWA